MADNNIPPGNHQHSPPTSGLATSDKIAIIIAAAMIGGGFVVAALMVKVVITALMGVSLGIGILGALPIGIGIAVAIMVIFGLVAGDAVGELPTMLVGFFLMTIFFTAVIAVVY